MQEDRKRQTFTYVEFMTFTVLIFPFKGNKSKVRMD